MDRIYIRAYPFRSVSISCAVLIPGTYLMNEGDSIKDVIEKSGGFTENAYVLGTIYQNLNTKAISQQAAQKLYENSIKNIAQLIKSTGEEIDFVP